jgi:hypothetical protein
VNGHRLAVDAPGTRAGLPAGGDPDPTPQGVVDPLLGAVVPPLGEVVVDGALGRQVVRQHVPLAAGAVEIEQGVEHLPHVVSPGPADLLDGDQRLDDRPLLVAEVGGVRPPRKRVSSSVAPLADSGCKKTDDLNHDWVRK